MKDNGNWFSKEEIFSEYGALNAIEKQKFYKRKTKKKREVRKNLTLVAKESETLFLNSLINK